MMMTNRHVKTINGRKYYYQSIRLGKKVTSKYIGPVETKRKKVQEKDSITNSAENETNYIG
ncbi:MAG: hypothetical protein HY513_01575 [Candidatus Aenigmarchaeota archaeon]|nr:hypothetical protein [Candidatus Aenigmarchaeota archaeon]